MAPAMMDDRELLSRLVGFDTTSERSNIEAIDFICNYLDCPGARLDRVPAAKGKENLVVEVGPERSDGSGLTLSGHLDCVPPGTGWTGEPFRLEERDEHLFARGSCDMKGFDALAINAMARSANGALSAPMAMVLTCDEELGGLGAAALVEAWPRERVLPRATIIGEPTMLQVVQMHKGHMKFQVCLAGASGHSGNPAAGHNAIETAGAALGVLSTLAGQFQERRTDASQHFNDVPHPVLAIVGVDGGEAWNVIPDACQIRCGLRVMPDQDATAVLEEIRSALADALPADTWTLEVYNDNPPLCTGEDTTVNRLACEAVGQDHCVGVSFCSDGGHLAKLGLECVLWGPGSIEQAHQPDEFISLEQYNRGSELLAGVIERHCSPQGTKA